MTATATAIRSANIPRGAEVLIIGPSPFRGIIIEYGGRRFAVPPSKLECCNERTNTDN
jgi:hypothetical protein